MSEQIARQFHDTYERLAPHFGYETREDTRVFDPQSQNGRLMIAVCVEVIGKLERERDEACKLAESSMFETDRLRGRLARVEQEKDEAQAQYQTTHLLAEALAKTQVELKAERDNWREAAVTAVKDRDHNKREWDKCAAQLAAVLVEAAE